MEVFLGMNKTCRRQEILGHFGEKLAAFEASKKVARRYVRGNTM